MMARPIVEKITVRPLLKRASERQVTASKGRRLPQIDALNSGRLSSVKKRHPESSVAERRKLNEDRAKRDSSYVYFEEKQIFSHFRQFQYFF